MLLMVIALHLALSSLRLSTVHLSEAVPALPVFDTVQRKLAKLLTLLRVPRYLEV